MDVHDPEPKYETVIDLDLYFLGGEKQPLTLYVDQGDKFSRHFDRENNIIDIYFRAKEPHEHVRVECRNLLWYSERKRQKLIPVKKFQPSEKSATATT